MRKHTTCETVNKSSDGNLALQHSDETVNVMVLSQSHATYGMRRKTEQVYDKQVVNSFAACFFDFQAR